MTNQYRNRPLILLKCIEKGVAESIIKTGTFRFYSPQKWVTQGLKGNEGQGDKFEGTIAAEIDGKQLSRLKKRYGGNLIVQKDDDVIYYQLHTSLECPTCCFYSLSDLNFESDQKISEIGTYPVSHVVKKQYIEDFFGKLSDDEISSLPEEKRPVLIVINNYDNKLSCCGECCC